MEQEPDPAWRLQLLQYKPLELGGGELLTKRIPWSPWSATQANQEPRHLQVQGLSNVQELGTQWLRPLNKPCTSPEPLSLGERVVYAPGRARESGEGVW